MRLAVVDRLDQRVKLELHEFLDEIVNEKRRLMEWYTT